MLKRTLIREAQMSVREKEHGELARKLAGECIVLMENSGVLPLAGRGNIALFGSGARQTIRGGTGSGDVNVRSSANIEQGLQNAGFTVTTKAWLDRQDAHHAEMQQAYFDWIPVQAKKEGISEFLVAFSNHFQVPAPVGITQEDIRASETDTAVYIVSRTAGEGADRSVVRGDYLLYAEEREQLRQIAANYPKTILVLNVGGVMDLSEARDMGLGAIVLMGQLGSVGGDALADVLTGAVNPSGRLTDTWAAQYADYPSAMTYGKENGNVDDEYYTEGVFVGYRHFSRYGVAPLYPFGYGLSYTTFEHTAHVVSAAEKITLAVTVCNTGAAAGREVVQVYAAQPETDLAKPCRKLVAFAKTKVLAPEETQTLEIAFSAEELASYDEGRAAWVLEAGEYVLSLGKNEQETAEFAVLTLDCDVMTRKLRNLFRDEDPVTEIVPPQRICRVNAALPRIAIDAEKIACQTAAYTEKREAFTTEHTEKLTLQDVLAGRCTAQELVAQLTIREMADLCVGTLRADASVVGNASYGVPGAAGDTSGIVADRGVLPLILADGPAGLRLQPVVKTDKQGRVLPGGEVENGVAAPFDPAYTDENTDTYYQYCTAIPVGWSLAQSWNMPMLEEAGSMIGREMEIFGIDLWLAPAMNIHRNPLCGRNFEYYSEDPLVAGSAASAITRGVQSHKGCGVTIKHFAANSQEENRYFTNAHVSERALREIYLRGFEMVMRGASPRAVMTSYNLLCGTHTANSMDLIQHAARDEWGYEGLIMTDWFTSQHQPTLTGVRPPKYGISSSVGCVRCGNDMQMPGCRENVEDIVRMLETGEPVDGLTITLADLQACALRVIATVLAGM